MYKVTFRGKVYPTSGAIFWSVFGLVFAVFLGMMVWLGWLVYLSTSMLEDYTGIPAIVCGLGLLVLLGSLTVNGQEKALLPPLLRRVLGLSLALGTLYYEYAIQHWEMEQLLLLSVPFAVLVLSRLPGFKLAKSQ